MVKNLITFLLIVGTLTVSSPKANMTNPMSVYVSPSDAVTCVPTEFDDHYSANSVLELCAMSEINSTHEISVSLDAVIFNLHLADLNPDGSVHIPDESLREVLEAALGKEREELISPIDMAQLTSLVASGRGISDLSGLEFAIRLTQLDISENLIEELEPISNLRYLEWLSIEDNLLTSESLRSLSNITSLKVLSLAMNNINSLFAIPHLSNLRVLDLSSNNISNLALISGFSMLEGLNLSHNEIEDLTPLVDLTNLRWLFLTDNAIHDISPIENLNELMDLSLAGNEIVEISPLAQLQQLRFLDLSSNLIRDISVIAGLESLDNLILDDNRIEDVSPIINNSALTSWGYSIDIGQSNFRRDYSESSKFTCYEWC